MTREEEIGYQGGGGKKGGNNRIKEIEDKKTSGVSIQCERKVSSINDDVNH